MGSDGSPGGSSGGEAATLAAGLSGLGAGSDIAGSLRNPAHYSGVYGHKPTWGLISTRGHAPPGILTPTDISVVACHRFHKYEQRFLWRQVDKDRIRQQLIRFDSETERLRKLVIPLNDLVSALRYPQHGRVREE